MKKILLSIVLFLIFLMNLEAQNISDSKLYFKLYGNYGFSLSSSYRTSDNTTSYSDTEFTKKTNNKGLGKGPTIGIGIGYVANDLISIGIDLDRYWTNLETFETNSTNAGGYINNTNLNFKSSIIMLTPNITFKAIAQPKFFIYNRIGLVFGISKKFEEEVKYEGIDNVNKQTSYSITQHKYEGGLPVGFRSALGIQTKLSDKIRFFAEVQFSHITYSPKKKVMTGGSILNPGDTTPKPINLSDLKTINKDTEYVDELTQKWNDPVDNDAPGKETKLRIPYTSLSVGVGLVYRL